MGILILCGALVGLALGLTGGGGSLLAVPMLVYLLDMPAQTAVTMSLAVVGTTAAFGAIESWRARVLMPRAALFFIVGGILGAPAGVQLAELFSEQGLMLAFGGLMVAVAVTMLQRSLSQPEYDDVVRADFGKDMIGSNPACRYEKDGKLRITAPCTLALVAGGLATGVLAGLFGVGGGFLIVPALMLITQMDIRRAVGTSLLVIAAIGYAGLASAIHAGRELDWALVGIFSVGGLLGMFLGRLLARRLSGLHLQRIFAISAAVLGAVVVLDSSGVI